MGVTCGFDASGNPRTAMPGFNCRVDSARGLWAFCPTSVISASDCGMAGYCVDSYSCSSGCGPLPGRTDITTFTCTKQGERYCSTAISDDNIYIACGAEAITATLYASPRAVSATTTTSIRASQTTSSTTTPVSTSPALTSSSSSNTPSPIVETSASTGAATPIGAVVGGVLGGIAIICLTVLAVVFIRRKRASPTGHSAFSSPPYYNEAACGHGPDQAESSELYSDHHDSVAKEPATGTTMGLFEASGLTRSPVELPATFGHAAEA